MSVAGTDWTRKEVEAIVSDYLAMLSFELAGMPYSKAVHRRQLMSLLTGRSEQSIEYKHANISAALLELGFPYISGYKPRSNYQHLLIEVVSEQLSVNRILQEIAASDADRPMVVPDMLDILPAMTDAPLSVSSRPKVADSSMLSARFTTNYIERESRNRSLGLAGEEFVLAYERARLIKAGREKLADRIEHTSQVRGDCEGYDVLSFEESGAERLIEVKTTKYGKETPFFVSRNEVSVSERHASNYFVYRMFGFRDSPRLYTLHGAISASCELSAASFLALPR